MRGQSALVGPVAPDEGEGREALGAPMMSKGVEQSVGSGVVGLAWIAEQGCDGGEEDEGGQVAVFSELV
jgi:hypothetical protein